MSVAGAQELVDEPEFLKKFASYSQENNSSDSTTQESRYLFTHDVIGKPLRNFYRSNE